MIYSILGKTGRKVSRIGFGGATAGLKNYTGAFDPQKQADREGVVAAIRRAYELGINYFDTAAGYGDGASEEIFGEGLAGIPEEEIFLATKAFPTDPKKVRASLERSLKNLRRERIDLIQLHGSYLGPEVGREIFREGGILQELKKLRDEGLVRYLGFSIECQNEVMHELIACGEFDVMQIEYNFLFQHPYDPYFHCGSLYDAEEQKLGIVNMRTATSGIFQKWIRLVNPENTFDYNAALIQFVLSNPLVDVSLLGMRDAEIVEKNVATCNDLSGRIDIAALHERYS